MRFFLTEESVRVIAPYQEGLIDEAWTEIVAPHLRDNGGPYPFDHYNADGTLISANVDESNYNNLLQAIALGELYQILGHDYRQTRADNA